MLPLLVLLGTIAGAWYLLIVRPQKDQQTRHGRLVDRLQAGDHVLTIGGIYGRVSAMEGSSVVLELAPGLTSRIATNGIARIVHGGEAALPTSIEPPRQALDTDMHQHPQDQQHAAQPAHPQFAAPSYAAPQQPYPTHPQVAAPQPAPFTPAPAPAPAPAPGPYAAAPVAQAPTPAHPHQLRPDPIPTFEPRPWGDVAPVNSMRQHGAPVQYAATMPPAAPAPMATSSAMQQPAMPLHAPFAPPAPTMQQPAQPATMQAPQPMTMQAPPVMPVAHPATAMQPIEVQPAVVEESSRPHSLAPEGMGSLLRLDDPSLRDAMDRARDERAGLAVEYRKLTAPLVDIGTSEQSHQEPVQQQQPHPDAVLVGHDPNGVPLFAAPDAPMVQPVAHYPGPARIAGASSMPRPVVQAPAGPTDPALTSAAFQRRTPYAPDPALQPALQPALVPATAPVHAPA